MGPVLVDLKKYIDDIFTKLLENKLLDYESNFYEYAYSRTLSTCSHFLPIIEIYEQRDINYLQNSVKLFASTFFLDFAIDNENSNSKKVRSLAIFNLLNNEYLADISCINIKKDYNKQLTEYYKYLIVEKKWEFPTEYFSYITKDEYPLQKAGVCLFPIKLVKTQSEDKFKLIKKYYNFLLIGDDIVDFEEDVKNKCLTYIIWHYWKKEKKLPTVGDKLGIDTIDYFKEYLRKLKIDIESIMLEKGIYSSTIDKNLNQHIKI